MINKPDEWMNIPLKVFKIFPFPVQFSFKWNFLIQIFFLVSEFGGVYVGDVTEPTFRPLDQLEFRLAQNTIGFYGSES